MNKILVSNNGDSPGKSELTWNLAVDGETIDEMTNPRKTGDGETILLGNSRTVTKGKGATLTVLGSLTDDDGFLKGADDVGSFHRDYTEATGYGVGSHIVNLTDGKNLNASLFFTIAKV